MSFIFTLLWLAVAVLGLGSYCYPPIRDFVCDKLKFLAQPQQALWLASACGVAAVVHLFGIIAGLAIAVVVFFVTNRAAWGNVKDAASKAATDLKDRIKR